MIAGFNGEETLVKVPDIPNIWGVIHYSQRRQILKEAADLSSNHKTTLTIQEVLIYIES